LVTQGWNTLAVPNWQIWRGRLNQERVFGRKGLKKAWEKKGRKGIIFGLGTRVPAGTLVVTLVPKGGAWHFGRLLFPFHLIVDPH